MKHFEKRFSLLLLAVALVLLNATSRSQDVGRQDVKPGDADYPAENVKPTNVVQFVAIVPSWMRVRFAVLYMPALFHGSASGGARCSYKSGSGVATFYSVSMPLTMSLDKSEAGRTNSHRSAIAVDKFQPGRCHWELAQVRYLLDDNGTQDFVLFHYSGNADGEAASTVDFECARVPAGYQTSHPQKKLRAIACQEDSLPKNLLLKYAADTSRSQGWDGTHTLGGKSVKAYFRDVDIPVNNTPYVVY